ncbi:hypothetical protein Tco_1416634 [Tanacetum coccineum]
MKEQLPNRRKSRYLHDTIATQRKFLLNKDQKLKELTSTKNQSRNPNDDQLKACRNYKTCRIENQEVLRKYQLVDSSKSEVIKEESTEEVKEEDKDEESTRKRKFGTRKKMNKEKKIYSKPSEDDRGKENDELRLYF